MSTLRIMNIAVNYLLVYILSLLCFCFCCVELNSFLGGVCLTRSCCAHWPFQRYAWDWVHSYKQSHSPIVQFDATLIQSPSIYIQLFSRSLVRHSSFFISNISPMKNCTDLNLGEGLCIFTSFHFPCFRFPACTWEHPRLKIPSVYMHKPYFNFK